jgi:endonuclease YncB( thermonuclease family)
MTPDHRWKWAGIVSAVSIGGVLLTDIAANVVGGYISDRIKTWDVPELAASAPAMQSDVMAAAAPVRAEKESQPAADAAPKTLPPPEPLEETAVTPEPEALPEAQPPARNLTGKVEQVLDTATLKVDGETIRLAGINGFGPPYRDQLAKFIQEQGAQISCTPNGARHICFVKNVDLALAALTNGAARPTADATPQYRHAADEAKANKRGVYQ